MANMGVVCPQCKKVRSVVVPDEAANVRVSSYEPGGGFSPLVGQKWVGDWFSVHCTNQTCIAHDRFPYWVVYEVAKPKEQKIMLAIARRWVKTLGK
jgi:hypothetical protein